MKTAMILVTALWLSHLEVQTPVITDRSEERTAALKVMNRHLKAVSEKDLKTLQATLSPKGDMQLILPSSEIKSNNQAFMNFHKEWFASGEWTFETKVLNAKVGESLASVTVEIMYREPMRDGQPYFNRMAVSYVLEKIKGQWFVVRDHASSIEKSTNMK